MTNLRNASLWRVLERGSGVLSRWGFRGFEGIAGHRQQSPPGPASVVGHSVDAVMSGSLEGIITGWSPGAERLYGYSADEAVGRLLWEVMEPLGGSDVVARNIDKVKRGEVLGPFDAVHHDRDGRPLHVSVLLSPIKDPAGQVLGVSVISCDTTGCNETGPCLRLLELAVENANDVVMISEAWPLEEPGPRIVYVNEAFTRMTGYAREEAIGRTPRFLQGADTDRSQRNSIREALSKWEPIRTEMVNYRKDGTKFWVDLNIVPVADEAGCVTHWISVQRETTEHRKAEEELEKSEQRSRALVWNAPNALAILEPDNTIRYDSPAIERVLGYRPDERIGNKCRDYTHPDDVESVDRAFAKLLDKPGASHSLEYKMRHADGSWRCVETVYSNLLDDPTVRGGVVVNYRDVTERREAEEKLRKSEASLAEAQRMSNLGNWEWDVKTGEVAWSDEVYHIYGFTPREIIPTLDKLMERVHPDDRELLRRAINGALYEGKPYDLEHRIVRPDGAERVVHRRAEVAFDEDGEPLRMVGTVHDITGRKRAEEALRESEERFRTAFENAPIGVAFVGTDDMRYLRVNRALCEMLGYSEEELLARTSREITHPDDLEASADRTRRVLEKGAGSSYLEKRYMHADGHIVWVLSSISLVRDSRGEPDYFVALFQNITERKALEERLEHQVLHDALTGLANRTLFMDRLEQALARLGRRDQPIAVLFVDLDDFKLVNDSLGHEVGDRLLVEVAGRLRECVRPEDTVARLGGDEFVVLLEGISDLGDARRVAERIVSSLEVPFCFEGREVFVGSSIGIAPASEAPDESEDLLRNADMALYRAKHRGKARYEFFDESMSNEALERLELESALKKALKREEFRVYYQPKLSMATGRIVSLEALVRWEHPERGLLEPSEFLPAAEKTGLIVQLGEWVLGEVCHQGREWQERFAGQSPPRVCTNVSSRQFLQTDLVREVAGALRESGLKAQGLSLEIPEGVLMDDAEANVEKLTALKDLGVHIVIDDFGTAFSSLSYLKNFPLNFLKIDRSLIVKLGEKPEDEAIVRAMISMAHALGWTVTAQGVENAEQLDLLRDLGCNIVQGYYFTKPVTSAEATELLEENFSTTISP